MTGAAPDSHEPAAHLETAVDADHTTARRRPARSQGRKSALTKTRILDAAAKVLSRQGYAGTRLAEVAEEAGLQAPAIYYYFASREELVEAVMIAGVRQMRVNLEKILTELDADSDPVERLLVAVEGHLRHELDISEYTTASIRNTGQVPAAIREKQFAEEQRYGSMWRALVEDVARAGGLRAGLDIHYAQMLILGALNWTAEWWEDDRGELDALVAQTRDFVRHAIAPHPLDSPPSTA